MSTSRHSVGSSGRSALARIRSTCDEADPGTSFAWPWRERTSSWSGLHHDQDRAQAQSFCFRCPSGRVDELDRGRHCQFSVANNRAVRWSLAGVMAYCLGNHAAGRCAGRSIHTIRVARTDPRIGQEALTANTRAVWNRCRCRHAAERLAQAR
jgi:hypothetical protein